MSVAEVALSALLGGIGGSVVGVVVTYYFEGRQEDRKVKVEEWKTVADEVYSPLIFDIMNFECGTLALLNALGELIAESPGKYTEEALANMIRSSSVPMQSKHTQSTIIENILRKNSRLIRPSGLWRDLYYFYLFLQRIEFFFSSISKGIYGVSPHPLLEVVQGCIKNGEILDDAASYLRLQLLNLVTATNSIPQSKDYKPFFNDDILAKEHQIHDSIMRVLQNRVLP